LLKIPKSEELSNKLTVTIFWQDQTSPTLLKLSNPSWDDLLSRLKNVSKFSNQEEDLTVTYQDSEEDMINIVNQEDFETCLEDLANQNFGKNKLLLWLGDPDNVSVKFKNAFAKLKFCDDSQSLSNISDLNSSISSFNNNNFSQISSANIQEEIEKMIDSKLISAIEKLKKAPEPVSINFENIS
jgi:hypothetical protein